MINQLNNWLNNPSFSFALKNCFFGTDKLTRNAIKSKFVYSARGTPFDGASIWSFSNEFTRNVVIFGFGNSSSSHMDNQKNNFWVLGEGPIYDFNDSVGTEEKKLVLTLLKQVRKFL